MVIFGCCGCYNNGLKWYSAEWNLLLRQCCHDDSDDDVENERKMLVICNIEKMVVVVPSRLSANLYNLGLDNN